MDTDDIVLVDEQPSMKLITSSHPPSQPCQAVPQMNLQWSHRPQLEIWRKSYTFIDGSWSVYRRNCIAYINSIRFTDTGLSPMDKLKIPEPTQMSHVPSELAHGENSRDEWTVCQEIDWLKARAEELRERIRAQMNAVIGFLDEPESLSKEPLLWSADELSKPTDKIRHIQPHTTLSGMVFGRNRLSLEDACMRNMFLLYRVGEITNQHRGHITTKRKMSPKLPLLYTFVILGVPCTALLHTPHWLGSKRALAGVVSGSAGITLPSLPEEPEHNILRSLVQVLWAVTYLAFLRFSYASLPVNRPIYLFCSLLLAAHFGLGIAGSADSNAEAVRVILGFGPLVTTACAALMYIPFRYTADVVASRSRRAIDAGDVEMAGGDETVPRANTHGDIGLERSIMHASTGLNL